MTGYGPHSNGNRLYFDGDSNKFELWETKFTGYLSVIKVSEVLTADNPDPTKNARAYAELVQILDDTSLTLIMRDAKNDGKKAMDILRDHYLGKSKPRIITLYGELASLKPSVGESMTDFVLRAETAATSLKSAGESVSDTLLIAMILRGLPETYSSFSTVITQKDANMTFADFKIAIRGEEENVKSRSAVNNDNVMQASNNNVIHCFYCKQPGHKKSACPKLMRNNSKPGNRGSRGYKRYNSYRNAANVFNEGEFEGNLNEGENDSEHTFTFKFTVGNESEENNCSESDNFSSALLVDSGATSHLLSDVSKFISFDENFDPKSHYIELADNSRVAGTVKARGDAKVSLCDVNGIVHEVTLKNALLVPSFKQEIFSVDSATKSNASVKFHKNHGELVSPDGTMFHINKAGKAYFLHEAKAVRSSTISSKSLQQWHRILGHCNVGDILKLEKCVKGMTISDKHNAKNFRCDTCIKGKMCQFRDRAPDKRAESVLELVHCDLAGPITPEAREGHKYAITFTCDYSGIIHVYFLRNKNDAARAFEKFIAETSSYAPIRRLRCDGGTEFTCKDFTDIAVRNKIKMEFSSPNSPHQNGVAERNWRTLFEYARCLLIDLNLPKYLWTYAVRHSAFIRNRCFIPRLGMTAYEKYTSRQPNLNKLEVFGAKCFAYVQNKKKLDQRSVEGIFVGFDASSPAYLVYHPSRNSVQRVRCVEFNNYLHSCESDVPLIPADLDDDKNSCDERNKSDTPVKNNSTTPVVPSTPSDHESSPNVKYSTPEASAPIDTCKSPIERRYPSRVRHPPIKYGECQEYDYDEDYSTDSSSACAIKSVDFCYRMSIVPNSYEAAINSTEADEWRQAMDEEIQALNENETYEITPLPPGRKCIGGRWVYCIKPGLNNDPKYKARYCAKGFTQKCGIDYEETFSPTARMTSFRTILHIAIQNDMSIDQMDVKSAFLHSEIDKEIYVKQPKGYEQYRNGQELCLRLRKSLYGLKQSSRNWNNHLNNFLEGQNFTKSLADPCLYIRSNSHHTIILLIWVDDLLICSNNDAELVKFKAALSENFKMKDLGPLNWFLGIKVIRTANSVAINQEDFICKILEKFGMENCKPKSLLSDVNVTKFDEEESPVLENPTIFREIIGSLIYVMSCTRPDLAYIVTKLSQFMSNPKVSHLSYAKTVLRYLKSTKDHQLSFHKSEEPLKLIGYTDSDWGGSSDRKSISGYCYKLNEQSALISWKSKKQSVVALSSCEAEYMALVQAVQEGKFLSRILADLTVSDPVSFNLFVDNQGAIMLAKNPVHRQRSKHIDIKYHFIRHEVSSGAVLLVYVPTEDNLADMLTKTIPRCKLNNLNYKGY